MEKPAFGSILQSLRKEKKITQEQLANHLGVSPQAVSKWENGSYPESDLLPALADYFDVSIDYLYGRGSANKSIETAVFEALQDAYEKESRTGENRSCHTKSAQLIRKILWTIQISPWQVQKNYYDPPMYSKADPKTSSLIMDDTMFSYMGLREDNPFYYYMSKTEDMDIFEDLLKDTSGICNLFKMLSDKDNMKIITYLYTLSGSACVTAGTISKALCINRDKVDKLLKSLVDYSIFNTSGNLPFHKIAIVNENGEEDAYEVDPNLGGIFLALMFLAKDYINPPCGYQMQVNSRSKSWADRGKLFGKS